MTEAKNTVKFQGNPLTLIGRQPVVGEPAPDFEVLANDMSAVKLSEFRGKVAVICSVPSLDTSVCDTEVRKFNEQATSLGDDVAVLVISMDLPFAQKRWCAAAGVNNVVLLSDHREASFGRSFGALIKELRLLARAVFVIDQTGIVRYVQYVEEITAEPDYGEVVTAARRLLER